MRRAFYAAFTRHTRRGKNSCHFSPINRETPAGPSIVRDLSGAGLGKTELPGGTARFPRPRADFSAGFPARRFTFVHAASVRRRPGFSGVFLAAFFARPQPERLARSRSTGEFVCGVHQSPAALRSSAHRSRGPRSERRPVPRSGSVEHFFRFKANTARLVATFQSIPSPTIRVVTQ